MTSRHRHLRRCRPTLRRHKRPSTRVGFRHRRHYHPLLLLYTVYSPECHPSRRTSSNRRTVSSNDIASPTWSLRLHSVTSHALPLPISVVVTFAVKMLFVERAKSRPLGLAYVPVSEAGLELSGGWGVEPPVHVYRRLFLSDRPKTSIPGQNFKHFGS